MKTFLTSSAVSPFQAGLLRSCNTLGAALALLSALLHTYGTNVFSAGWSNNAHSISMAVMAVASLWCALKLWRTSGVGAWWMLVACAALMIALHGGMKWQMADSMVMGTHTMDMTAMHRVDPMNSLTMSAVVIIAFGEMALAALALGILRKSR